MTRKSRKSRKIRKISLVLGIAVAAMSVGVPTALGEGRIAGSPEPDGVAVFRANEMSTLAQQSVSPVSTYRDAGERGAVVSQTEPQWMKALNAQSQALNRKYGLGEFSRTSLVSPAELRAINLRSEALNKKYGLGESAQGIGKMSPAAIHSLFVLSEAQHGLGEFANNNVSTYRDAGERAVPQPQSPQITPTTSGTEIEWPQVGVGLGIALFLVLGIGLAVRNTHMRPAH